MVLTGSDILGASVGGRSGKEDWKAINIGVICVNNIWDRIKLKNDGDTSENTGS